MRFFWGKQSDTETPKGHWEKSNELEKDCEFPDFSTELLISKIITSITDKKLMKEKDLDVAKAVEQIQNTHDRKKRILYQKH